MWKICVTLQSDTSAKERNKFTNTKHFTIMKAKLLLLVFSLLCISMAAQTMKVTGTVADEQGDPIIGVTVAIEGTSVGTITDVDGKYTIDVEKGKVLVFSYVGLKTKKVKVNKPIIDVVLEDDDARLEEVVVVGYGTSPQKSMTGSISQVSDALSGRVSGVIVNTPTSSAGFGIRGVSTLSGYNDSQSDEEYESFSDNAFKSPLKEALSTFSIDVDVASYSNMRRMINQGRMPNMDAIRTEELVNYFDYDYPQPTGNDPVRVIAEIGDCPWNKQHRLVKLGLKAREMDKDNLPPSNLVFLIDVSGSMSGATRIDLVKSSMKLLVNNLRETDNVSIVTYANGVDVRLESTSGKENTKIIGAIDGLIASGGTSGGRGIQLAYEQAKKNFRKDGNNRIILCTDGDFNIGPSNPDELKKLIEKERNSGVYLSILGYGMGNYKDNRMQALAQAGNGNHAYIDNIQEANKVLVKEFGSTMHTIAKDVKLQLEFNPAKVQAYRLIGYETRLLAAEDFNDDKKDAGEMGVGHTVTAMYEIVPVGVKSNVYDVDPLKYQKEVEQIISGKSNDLFTVKMRYKNPDSSKSQLFEQAIIDKGGNNVSSDFNFAASVVMCSQLLRDSQYKGDTTYDDVIKLAKSSLGNDKDGYRSEFVRLMEVVKGLSK